MKFKQYLNEIDTKKSVFDSSINTVVLYKSDEQYEQWKSKFKSYGIAIGVINKGKNMIIWDGEEKKKLNPDQILFVEAHEYSHFKIGKNATEAECDWLAIHNLWKKGYKNAAKIGVSQFYDRNGSEFDTTELKGYK